MVKMLAKKAWNYSDVNKLSERMNLWTYTYEIMLEKTNELLWKYVKLWANIDQ